MIRSNNFSANIVLNGGTPTSLFPNFITLDKGDGRASHASATTLELQTNGTPNGYLNGYAALALSDPNPVTTATVDYDTNLVRDEFNTAGAAAAI